MIADISDVIWYQKLSDREKEIVKKLAFTAALEADIPYARRGIMLEMFKKYL